MLGCKTLSYTLCILFADFSNHGRCQAAFARVIFIKSGTVYQRGIEDILHSDIFERFVLQHINQRVADGSVGFDDAGVGIVGHGIGKKSEKPDFCYFHSDKQTK